MPSFKLCMNSRMNLSAGTHLQRVHHPRTCAPSKAIHFSWSPRWWRSMSTSWSGKLLWESWTLFGPNTKKLTHGAFIWLNAPLCFCLPLPSICSLLCTSCCMIICFLRCDAATISWIWRSVDEKNLTLGGKVSRSLKMSAQQQMRQTKNPEGWDAWTLTVQIVCVQLQLST